MWFLDNSVLSMPYTKHNPEGVWLSRREQKTHPKTFPIAGSAKETRSRLEGNHQESPLKTWCFWCFSPKKYKNTTFYNLETHPKPWFSTKPQDISQHIQNPSNFLVLLHPGHGPSLLPRVKLSLEARGFHAQHRSQCGHGATLSERKDLGGPDGEETFFFVGFLLFFFWGGWVLETKDWLVFGCGFTALRALRPCKRMEKYGFKGKTNWVVQLMVPSIFLFFETNPFWKRHFPVDNFPVQQ